MAMSDDADMVASILQAVADALEAMNARLDRIENFLYETEDEETIAQA